MKSLRVILDHNNRQQYLDDLLAKDGLSHIEEDEMSAYCPISLTQTPNEIKSCVQARQKILMDQVLYKAGITAYDPSSAPYSPDKDLKKLPQEIYLVDSAKIVGARFFVGHNLTASTGFGVELEKAIKFNRIAVILMDKKIRISRMQPHRAIYLQYDNFEQQADEFVKVFKLLSEYEPGMGFEGREPILLGYKNDNQATNLERLIYETFPHLKYEYDGQQSALKLSATNPDLFYENLSK